MRIIRFYFLSNFEAYNTVLGALITVLWISAYLSTSCKFVKSFSVKNHVDFSDGPVVKNLRANTGDTSSVPGPGRFWIPHATITEVMCCNEDPVQSKINKVNKNDLCRKNMHINKF